MTRIGLFINLFWLQMNYVSKLIQSKSTVFTYKDFSILLRIENRDTIKSMISRYVKSGILEKKYQGVYSLPQFDIFELATKIKKNSYISFETVLKHEGIIYQDYGNKIFLASDKVGDKNIGEYVLEYRKIKDNILHNPLGILQKGQYAIACPERAVCDRLYISGNYYFDNIEHLNFSKLKEISKIYNKRVILSINKLINDFEHRKT